MRTIKFTIALLVPVLFSSCIVVEDVTVDEITSFKVKNMTADKAELEVGLLIDNPNAFKIKVTDADLDIYMNRKKVGTAKLIKNIGIPKISSDVHQVFLSCDFNENALPTSSRRSIYVKIKGTIRGKAFGIPKTLDVSFTEKIDPDLLSLSN
jgi:LEA14-like dessication related protein